MPENQPHKTKPKDRVRIKDSVTHMYPMARAFSEAVVKKRMHDPLGYPMIFVEWDKDHWAYSGEENGWAFEAHFDRVEETEMAEEKGKPDLAEALAKLLEQYRPVQEDSETGSPQENDPDQEDGSDYESILAKALEDAQDGEAYIVLVAYPEEYQGTPIIVPRIYTNSKRDDAALLLDATMADFVAQSYSRMVTDLIQARRDNGSET